MYYIWFQTHQALYLLIRNQLRKNTKRKGPWVCPSQCTAPLTCSLNWMAVWQSRAQRWRRGAEALTQPGSQQTSGSGWGLASSKRWWAHIWQSDREKEEMTSQASSSKTFQVLQVELKPTNTAALCSGVTHGSSSLNWICPDPSTLNLFEFEFFTGFWVRPAGCYLYLVLPNSKQTYMNGGWKHSIPFLCNPRFSPISRPNTKWRIYSYNHQSPNVGHRPKNTEMMADSL